jgi:hypothetical protein
MTSDRLSHHKNEATDPRSLSAVHFTTTVDDQTWQCILTEHGASSVIEVRPPKNFWIALGRRSFHSKWLKPGDLELLGEEAVVLLAQLEVSLYLQKLITRHLYTPLLDSIGSRTSQTEESCGNQSSNTNSDTPEANSQSQSQMKAETLSQSNIVATIIMPGMNSPIHILKGETAKVEEGTVTIQVPGHTYSEQDPQTDQSGSLKENSTQSSLGNMESMPLRQRVVLDLLLENFYQFCGPQEEFLMSALTGIVLDRMRKQTSWIYTDPLAESRLEEYLSRRAKILETYYQYYQTRPKESRN